MALKCDVCGGPLTVHPGGQGAYCPDCGLNYTMERLQNMLKEQKAAPMVEEEQGPKSVPVPEPAPKKTLLRTLHRDASWRDMTGKTEQEPIPAAPHQRSEEKTPPKPVKKEKNVEQKKPAQKPKGRKTATSKKKKWAHPVIHVIALVVLAVWLFETIRYGAQIQYYYSNYPHAYINYVDPEYFQFHLVNGVLLVISGMLAVLKMQKNAAAGNDIRMDKTCKTVLIMATLLLAIWVVVSHFMVFS